MEYECSTGLEEMTMSRSASRSLYLLVEGANRLVPKEADVGIYTQLSFFTETGITDCTSTKRFTKGRPLAAQRSTMILSAPQSQAKVALPRLSVSVSRFGV